MLPRAFQIVQIARFRGRVGRNGRSGCCHQCCHAARRLSRLRCLSRPIPRSRAQQLRGAQRPETCGEERGSRTLLARRAEALRRGCAPTRSPSQIPNVDCDEAMHRRARRSVGRRRTRARRRARQRSHLARDVGLGPDCRMFVGAAVSVSKLGGLVPGREISPG
jgi:hypothetical protein